MFVSGTTISEIYTLSLHDALPISATASDGDSGILRVTFPGLSGFTSGGGADTSSPYSSGTYSWSGAVGEIGRASCRERVEGRVGGGAVSRGSADTARSTGGAVQRDGVAVAAGRPPM